MASKGTFLSLQFFVFFGLEVFILGIYAILWQQVIKRFDLSVVYANRSVSLVWSLMWAVLIFHEVVTIQNIIGGAIIILGTMIVNKEKE